MTEFAAEELLKQLKEQQETEKEQVSGHLEAEELEELHKVRVGGLLSCYSCSSIKIIQEKSTFISILLHC